MSSLKSLLLSPVSEHNENIKAMEIASSVADAWTTDIGAALLVDVIRRAYISPATERQGSPAADGQGSPLPNPISTQDIAKGVVGNLICLCRIQSKSRWTLDHQAPAWKGDSEASFASVADHYLCGMQALEERARAFGEKHLTLAVLKSLKKMVLTPPDGGLTCQPGRQRRVRDRNGLDNGRKSLFRGTLDVLQELADIMIVTAGAQNRGRSDQWSAAKNDGYEEWVTTVWDIVAAGLLDTWSDIRLLCATRAKILAVTLGSSKVRVFYLRAAHDITRVGLASESPSQWKKLHGLLLGMRAAIDGSAIAERTCGCRSLPTGQARDSLETPVNNCDDEASGQTPSFMRKEQTCCLMLAEVEADVANVVECLGSNVGWRVGSTGLMDTCLEPAEQAEFWRSTNTVAANDGATVPTRSRKWNKPSESSEYASRDGERNGSDADLREDSGHHPLSAPTVMTVDDCGIPTSPLSQSSWFPPTPPLHPVSSSSHELSRSKFSPLRQVFGCLGYRQEVVRSAATGMLESLAALGKNTALALHAWTIDELERTSLLTTTCNDEHSVDKRRICEQARGLLDLMKQLLPLVSIGTVSKCWNRLFTALRPFIGDPESSTRQVATSVLLRIVSLSTKMPNGVSTSQVEAPGTKPGTVQQKTDTLGSARVVLGTLTQAWDESLTRGGRSTTDNCKGERKLDSELVNRTDSASGGSRQAARPSTSEHSRQIGGRADIGSSSETIIENSAGKESLGNGTRTERMKTWTFREGALMTYEAMLKHFVGMSSRDLDSHVCAVGASGSSMEENTSVSLRIGSSWPHTMLESAPTMRELLASIARHAESALFEAEVGMSCRVVAGALELRRAGAQLLPTLARALLWWDPQALPKLCHRAAEDAVLDRSKSNILRRTRLSMACELIRASVMHARHLAELYTSAVSTRGASLRALNHQMSISRLSVDLHSTTSRRAPSPKGEPQRRGAYPVGISISGQERWGSSTEGIVDSGTSSRPKEAQETTPDVESEDIVSRLKTLADTAAGSPAGSLVHGSPEACRAQLVQVVEHTTSLCRRGQSSLLRCLAAIVNFTENTPVFDSPNSASASNNAIAYEARPVGVLGAVENSSSDEGDSWRSEKPGLWVYTGVMEALVLASSFSFTTTVLYSGTREYDRDTHSVRNDHISGPSQNEQCGGHRDENILWNSMPKTGSTSPCSDTDAAAALVAQQLGLLHEEVFPAKSSLPMACSHECESMSALTDYKGHQPLAVPDRPASGSMAASLFAIPFSPRSLPIVRVWLSAARNSSEGAGVRTVPGCTNGEEVETRANALRLSRKALQLDRQLSIGVVRALPGYVRSLHQSHRMALLPCLLNWVEARDENIRWITIAPRDARGFLFSSIRSMFNNTNPIPVGDEGCSTDGPPPPDPTAFESSTHGRLKIASVESLTTFSCPKRVADAKARIVFEHRIGKALIRCLEVIAAMLSEERLEPSLFAMACLLAYDAISCLIVNIRHTKREATGGRSIFRDGRDLSTIGACVFGQPISSQLGRTLACPDSAAGRSQSTPLASNAAIVEPVFLPLMSAVAEHLLHHYSQCRSAVVNEQAASNPHIVDASVETKRSLHGDDCPQLREVQGSNSGDGDGASDWDDWDDDEETQSVGGGEEHGGIVVANASEEERFAESLQVTAVLMSAAEELALELAADSGNVCGSNSHVNYSRSACTNVTKQRSAAATTKGIRETLPSSVFRNLSELNQKILTVAWRQKAEKS